jgi:hypothetical protein
MVREYTRTNRDDDGDEIFHDLVDFADQLQPVVPGSKLMPPYVERDAFIPLAKKWVQEVGLASDRLHGFVLDREDFAAVVGLLAVLDVEPKDWDETIFGKWITGVELRRDRFVRAVFGKDGKSVDFDRFDDAFTTSESDGIALVSLDFVIEASLAGIRTITHLSTASNPGKIRRPGQPFSVVYWEKERQRTVRLQRKTTEADSLT